jgi:hypothetical protein
MTVGTKNGDQDSNSKNSGRQCHFKIWLDCNELKKIPA